MIFISIYNKLYYATMVVIALYVKDSGSSLSFSIQKVCYNIVYRPSRLITLNNQQSKHIFKCKMLKKRKRTYYGYIIKLLL